ncbi:prolyl aminopeptidase [Colwellia sp. 4_MG-2023]|uniref:prolyl aminopeptidase n=1 Tax=unclassified Colwellia TaxID=196834 RepID=UPI001C08DBBF|nr:MULTISPECIES: prolyl aminopeptidase [unclassified Colwellia]MBU2924147.1 prolyl aminopeptidase [Colwellia sp. C2M11]MDO6506180.1 prolyl aminopeptidase [Colwellia sp. 5_MG-2023]MDO6554760.1 prolyl aminopeptidase [Colwellia sp. 4_MG-2023]MDO6652037.1 prolyl aminopeptidase [Colwellia sp. 3_MG-2023]MDO6664813.1 prolyl aminopeptidase [Colwellia sp. 2_MG-2023]
MLSLYPAIEPFHHYYLNVANIELGDEEAAVEHQLYVEQCGNPTGIPVLFLHGGPGSGCRASHRCFFDPKLYHIILFDQRGCGRSRPYGALAHNTTANLIQDIEAIRQHLNIDQWLIFGGSWGTTLGLHYAKNFSQYVSGLILRGVFLGRAEDIDWVYSANGAAKIFPDAWSHLVKGLPLEQVTEPLSMIYQQLTSDNIQTSNRIFSKLEYWEANLIYWQNVVDFKENKIAEDDKVPSIIQLYYSINKCFISDEPLLENIKSIRHIPTKIIHGRYDMVCPLTQAWQLKQHWPEAELSIIEMAGHVANEAKIIDALVQATDDFAANK